MCDTPLRWGDLLCKREFTPYKEKSLGVWGSIRSIDIVINGSLGISPGQRISLPFSCWMPPLQSIFQPILTPSLLIDSPICERVPSSSVKVLSNMLFLLWKLFVFILILSHNHLYDIKNTSSPRFVVNFFSIFSQSRGLFV